MRYGTPLVSALLVASLAGCGSSPEPQATMAAFDLQAFASRFEPGSVIGAPRLVECTLSGGMSTTCVADHAAGQS